MASSSRFKLDACHPLTAAPLLAEGVDRHAFDVVVFRDRDNHLLVGNQDLPCSSRLRQR